MRPPRDTIELRTFMATNINVFFFSASVQTRPGSSLRPQQPNTAVTDSPNSPSDGVAREDDSIQAAAGHTAPIRPTKVQRQVLAAIAEAAKTHVSEE